MNREKKGEDWKSLTYKFKEIGCTKENGVLEMKKKHIMRRGKKWFEKKWRRTDEKLGKGRKKEAGEEKRFKEEGDDDVDDDDVRMKYIG